MRGLRTTSAVGASLCLGVLGSAPAAAAPPRTPLVVDVTADRGKVLLSWVAAPRRAPVVIGYEVADRGRALAATQWEQWRLIERPASSRSVSVAVDPRSRHQLRLRARTVSGWGPWTAIHDIAVGRIDARLVTAR